MTFGLFTHARGTPKVLLLNSNSVFTETQASECLNFLYPFSELSSLDKYVFSDCYLVFCILFRYKALSSFEGYRCFYISDE